MGRPGWDWLRLGRVVKDDLQLTREIRKEEVEHLQHQMRWVSQGIIPITGLIGALMGLISLIRSVK